VPDESVAWLPREFVHPTRVELPTGHHLRPIRASDVDIDYPAVMGSQERLFAIFGPAWGWPPPTMTYEHDRADLARHEGEADAHTLTTFVPEWLRAAWPFTAPRVIGHDLTWGEWLALPEVDR
jgi:hypothetical protein